MNYWDKDKNFKIWNLLSQDITKIFLQKVRFLLNHSLYVYLKCVPGPLTIRFIVLLQNTKCSNIFPECVQLVTFKKQLGIYILIIIHLNMQNWQLVIS